MIYCRSLRGYRGPSGSSSWYVGAGPKHCSQNGDSFKTGPVLQSDLNHNLETPSTASEGAMPICLLVYLLFGRVVLRLLISSEQRQIDTLN